MSPRATVLALSLVALGCGQAPYPDYWPEGSDVPDIDGIEPSTVPDVHGGGEAVITGSHLATTRTVTFGGRNAKILDTTATSVTVEIPAYVPGGGSVDVALVTSSGAAREEGLFTYAQADRGWSDGEIATVSLERVECPIETTGYGALGEAAIFWCGFEAGWVYGEGWIAGSAQPGRAGDMAGFAQVSELPEIGEVRVLGPTDARPIPNPYPDGPVATDEAISLKTQRRFQRDLDLVAAREQLVADTYSWWMQDNQSSSTGPMVFPFDAEMCPLDPVVVTGAEADLLFLESEVDPATVALWMGFGITEDFGGGETYYTEGYTSTAWAAADGATIAGDEAGVDLLYDDYSGWMLADGVAGLVGMNDVLPGVEYRIDRKHVGEVTTLGTIAGFDDLEVHAPALMSGRVDVDRSQPLTVRWSPHEGDGDPSYLVIDIVVYDADVEDPGWLAEVGRLVAHGPDAEGVMVIPPEALLQLPDAANRLDNNYDLKGRWAEMTVARHQLRKIPWDGEGGILVVDFVDAVQGMVRLR